MNSATTSHEPLSIRPISTISPGIIVYSYSTPIPSESNGLEDVPLSTLEPTSTASTVRFVPPPPHIFPTWSVPSQPHHSQPTAANMSRSNVNTGAIAGGIVGGLALVILAVAAIFYCRSKNRVPYNRWKGLARDSWQDLEGKTGGAAAPSASAFPPLSEAKTPESIAQDNYTKYVPRSEGRFSPLTKTINPTFNRIAQHHSSSDPFSDRASSQFKDGFDGPCEDVDGFEMKVNPSSPERFPKELDAERNT
ncbi:hypothetical protein D9615_002500 [Tricholomella constricta]|uniref:Uncharacterized protein n=1 Tax=Tricholomella constricta TaxID=117010 RepID=A0A8H5M977_9AGAR|nr:hypothetical protein D9615_002500 [Tricholomella constricta]